MSIYQHMNPTQIAQCLLQLANVKTDSFTHTLCGSGMDLAIEYEADCEADAESFRVWLRFASVPHSNNEKFPSRVSIRVRNARSALYNFAPYLEEEQRRAHLKAAGHSTPTPKALPVKYSEISAMAVAGHALAHANAGPHHSYLVCSTQAVYSTEHIALAEALRAWLTASNIEWTSSQTRQRDGTDEFNTLVSVADLRACLEGQLPKPVPAMMPVTSPPTDPSQVVIVLSEVEDQKIFGSTFKYKKGKWCGQSSGLKFTTDELVDDPSTAFWIVSPLQPDYKDPDATLS